MKSSTEGLPSSPDISSELSFASRYILDTHKHKSPTYLHSGRNRYLLYVRLVPNTEGMHRAAKMEDEYRTQANSLAMIGEVERASQVIKAGCIAVEAYIQEQWCGQRIVGSVRFYEDVGRLEALSDAILKGSQSPMPSDSQSAYISAQTVALCENASGLL